MKKITALLVLCLVYSSQSVTPIQTTQIEVYDKASQALQDDLQRLLVECSRTKQELWKCLDTFQSSWSKLADNVESLSSKEANRAYVWAKAMLYKIQHSFDAVEKLYEHVTCTANTIQMNQELEDQLMKAQHEFASFKDQYLKLTEKLLTLRESVSKSLY